MARSAPSLLPHARGEPQTRQMRSPAAGVGLQSAAAGSVCSVCAAPRAHCSLSAVRSVTRSVPQRHPAPHEFRATSNVRAEAKPIGYMVPPAVTLRSRISTLMSPEIELDRGSNASSTAFLLLPRAQVRRSGAGRFSPEPEPSVNFTREAESVPTQMCTAPHPHPGSN